MNYKILQLDMNNEKAHSFIFRPLEVVADKFDEIKDLLKLYNCVYEGEYECESKSEFGILEDLYRKFNIDHPEDYRGHSLSVSDIVCLYDSNSETYYYCDSVGWRKLEH